VLKAKVTMPRCARWPSNGSECRGRTSAVAGNHSKRVSPANKKGNTTANGPAFALTSYGGQAANGREYKESGGLEHVVAREQERRANEQFTKFARIIRVHS
jgi:hypothetical protein